MAWADDPRNYKTYLYYKSIIRLIYTLEENQNPRKLCKARWLTAIKRIHEDESLVNTCSHSLFCFLFFLTAASV